MGKELGLKNIRTSFGSIRHPQSNPTGRVMRELGRMFRMLCSFKRTSWAKVVPQIENYLNCTTHCSTSYELHYGKSINEQVRKLVEYPEMSLPMSREQVIVLEDEIILMTEIIL